MCKGKKNFLRFFGLDMHEEHAYKVSSRYFKQNGKYDLVQGNEIGARARHVQGHFAQIVQGQISINLPIINYLIDILTIRPF